MAKFKDFFFFTKQSLTSNDVKKINIFNSFFWAIAIHAIITLIVFELFFNRKTEFKPMVFTSSEHRQSINLKNLTFVHKEKNIKKNIPINTKKILTNTVKKEVVKTQQDLNLTQKNEIKKIDQQKNVKVFPNKGIEKSYGEVFFTLSPEEQEYIVKNWSDNNFLNLLITQKVSRKYDLNKVKVGEQNIVIFYLNPDGSISDLHFENQNSSSEFMAIVAESVLHSAKLYKPASVPTLMRINVNTQPNEFVNDNNKS